MFRLLYASVVLGSRANADELNHSILIVKSIDGSTVPIANSRCPKGWRRLSSHSTGRVKMAGDFGKYNSHRREVFVTKIVSAQEMKMPTRPSSLRLDLACSTNEVEEFSSDSALITLAWVLVCQSWIVTEDHTDDVVEAQCVTILSVTKFSVLLLLPPKPDSILSDSLPAVKFDDNEAKDRLPSERNYLVQRILSLLSRSQFPILIVYQSYMTSLDV